MRFVEENREDFELNEAFAESIDVPLRKDPLRSYESKSEHVFYDSLKIRDAVFAGWDDSDESEFIRSLFSHNDESIVGKKQKIRQYVKKS